MVLLVEVVEVEVVEHEVLVTSRPGAQALDPEVGSGSSESRASLGLLSSGTENVSRLCLRHS